jgi:hypothetical protein
MPLGNGDAVLVIELAGIVALSDKPPTLGALVCTGMGLQKVDNTTATDFYCNIKQNNADSFDFKGNAAEADGKSKGTFNIVGGSGKWAGATGKGKFKRVSESDVGTKTVIEIEITAK